MGSEAACARWLLGPDYRPGLRKRTACRPDILRQPAGRDSRLPSCGESGTQLNCEEKTRVLHEYEAATAKFSNAVTELRARTPVSPAAEYERLKRAAEEARLNSERARLALEHHTAVHGC